MRKFKHFWSRGLFFFGFMLVFAVTGVAVGIGLEEFGWPEFTTLFWGGAFVTAFCVIQFVWWRSDRKE